MRKTKIFLLVAISFVTAVFLSFLCEFDSFLVYILIIFGIIIFSLGYRNKKALVLSLILLFFALGVFRTQTQKDKFENYELTGEKISTIGIVAKEPKKDEKNQKIEIETNIAGNKERILAKTDIYKDFSYGDEVKIKCTLQKPKNFSSDFNYQMYLAKDGIRYICQNAFIKKTGDNEGFWIYRGILYLKEKMERGINRLTPQPEAALANGLLFGGDDRLSEEVQEKFSKTGMTHIVAVSGYNVTIIAEYLIFFGIAVGLWRPQAFWFALIGIFLFVAMIGFPSSAIRAGVMGSLLLWAIKNGRLSNSYNALIFAGSVMIFLNPLILLYDIGFQLSFLAAAGIIFFSPIWEKYFSSKLNILGLMEIILLTISAQIFVLPVILLNFGYLSYVSLFANVLILPIIPISMFLSFASSALSLIMDSLALPFAWLNYWVLHYELGVLDWLSGLFWTGREVKFELIWFFVWYFALGAFFYWMFKIKRIGRLSVK